MCIACECAGDECNERDRSSDLDRGRRSIGFATTWLPSENLCVTSFCIPVRRAEFGEVEARIFFADPASGSSQMRKVV